MAGFRDCNVANIYIYIKKTEYLGQIALSKCEAFQLPTGLGLPCSSQVQNSSAIELFKKSSEGGVLSLWVRLLSQKCRDLSSNPQHQTDERWRQESLQEPGLTVTNKRHCLTQGRGWGPTLKIVSSDHYICGHGSTCTHIGYIYAYAHTHENIQRLLKMKFDE